MHDVGNHLCIYIKDPLKVKDRPMDFNVTGDENLTHMASESIMQLTFIKPLPVEFLHSIKGKYTVIWKDY